MSDGVARRLYLVEIRCPRCNKTRKVIKQKRKTALCQTCNGTLFRMRTLPLRSRLEEDRI
jgi:hypothetical protein